jgi:hypothetical protein
VVLVELRHAARALAPALGAQAVVVEAAQEEHAARRLAQPGQERAQRRLAAPRAALQEDPFARRMVKLAPRRAGSERVG